MNRFKKVLMSKGIKLAHQYECLPYDIKGHFGDLGYMVIENVIVDSENATFTEIYNVIVSRYKVLRSGEIVAINTDEEDGNPSFCDAINDTNESCGSGESSESGESDTPRFFRDDNLELLFESDLRKYADACNMAFDDFINSAIHAGFLTEVPAMEMKMISVETIYHTGQISHKGDEYMDYIYAIKLTSPNGNEVNWDGINHVIINEEDGNKIIQASGYNANRGLFCDLY